MRVNFNAPVLPVTEKKVVHNIAIRPVNINSIKFLIHKGIKYTVE